MALNKVTYVDGVTEIEAQNLNDIQDEIISNGDNITELQTISQTNTDDIDELQTISQNTVDYVTSQSTSGQWRYRIWKSGLKEMWLSRTGATISANSDSATMTINLPISITTLHTICFGSWQNTSSAVNATIWDLNGYASTSINVTVYRNYTDTAGWGISPAVSIYIAAV